MGLFSTFLRTVIPWLRPLAGRDSGSLATSPAGVKQPPRKPPAVGGDLQNEDWLLSGTWLHLFSSNVEACRYLWDVEVLEVQYRGESPTGAGYLYQYFSIPPQLASSLTTTASPGRWVWDHLRIRGTKEGYQKEYVRLSGFAGTPKKPGVGGKLPSGTPTTHPPSTIPPWAKKNSPWAKKP